MTTLAEKGGINVDLIEGLIAIDFQLGFLYFFYFLLLEILIELF